MKIALALILYFTLHSLLANLRVKAFLQQHLIPARWYRILYNLVAVFTLIPILFYLQQSEQNFLFQIPLFLKYIAYAGILAAILLLLIALIQYDLGEFSGLSYLGSTKKNQEQTLQVKGLNSYVRHPLYFASLLLFWFYFLAFPTTIFLMVAIISSLYLYAGARLEEEKLLLNFGDSYRRYQQEVPMLWPAFKYNNSVTKA
jgi:methanethiol S-methyltransferase